MPFGVNGTSCFFFFFFGSLAGVRGVRGDLPCSLASTARAEGARSAGARVDTIPLARARKSIRPRLPRPRRYALRASSTKPIDGRHTNARTLFKADDLAPLKGSVSRGDVRVQRTCWCVSCPRVNVVVCSPLCGHTWTRVSCVALTRAMCAARSCRQPARTCDSCVGSFLTNGYKNTGTAPNLTPVYAAPTLTLPTTVVSRSAEARSSHAPRARPAADVALLSRARSDARASRCLHAARIRA